MKQYVRSFALAAGLMVGTSTLACEAGKAAIEPMVTDKETLTDNGYVVTQSEGFSATLDRCAFAPHKIRFEIETSVLDKAIANKAPGLSVFFGRSRMPQNYPVICAFVPANGINVIVEGRNGHKSILTGNLNAADKKILDQHAGCLVLDIAR